MAFDQFKQIGQLKKMKKEMEEALRPLEESVEKGDVKVKVNGLREVVYIEIDGEEREDVVKIINKASKKVERKSAKKMMEMGGGLSGLLGGMN